MSLIGISSVAGLSVLDIRENKNDWFRWIGTFGLLLLLFLTLAPLARLIYLEVRVAANRYRFYVSLFDDRANIELARTQEILRAQRLSHLLAEISKSKGRIVVYDFQRAMRSHAGTLVFTLKELGKPMLIAGERLAVIDLDTGHHQGILLVTSDKTAQNETLLILEQWNALFRTAAASSADRGATFTTFCAAFVSRNN